MQDKPPADQETAALKAAAHSLEAEQSSLGRANAGQRRPMGIIFLIPCGR